ncbi:MAG TPA: hypothetical protein VJ552_08380 [Sediminibacterium sp.]|nr:hypothetical protein [Sediminibacterium sp.]
MLSKWLRISFFNLMLVAFLGVILRYKILYSLPFLDQKHLLHAHSHFAFSGWVSQLLMVLLVASLSRQKGVSLFAKYNRLLYANLITAVGMLIFFVLQGYALFSILFSTLSIVVSWLFAFAYWKDLNRVPVKTVSHYWIKAALVFNALSAMGAFSLAYMMANKTVHQNWYLLSVYFFLHFQYNGWFLFACMGLLMQKIQVYFPDQQLLIKIFRLFLLACVPAYFLSALWLNLPLWLYVLVVAAALAQIAGWICLVKRLFAVKSSLSPTLTDITKWLLSFSGVAFSIKLILQLGSTIPSLSQLAFGFRPIVIGYLHLILLGVITLFLLGYVFAEKMIPLKRTVKLGVLVFTAGVILNEFLLMIEGVAAMAYTLVPWINELLLFTAFFLFSGMLLLNFGTRRQKE